MGVIIDKQRRRMEANNAKAIMADLRNIERQWCRDRQRNAMGHIVVCLVTLAGMIGYTIYAAFTGQF